VRDERWRRDKAISDLVEMVREMFNALYHGRGEAR
jgi:hypothetical protein